MRLRLVPHGTKIDFLKHWKITAIISIVGFLLSAFAFITPGLNYGIDFRGGSVVMVDTPEAVDVGEYRAALAGLDLGDFAVTELTDPGAELTGVQKNTVLIKLEQESNDPAIQQDKLSLVTSTLKTSFAGLTVLSTESVGAKVSGELLRTGLMAVVAAALSMLVYIWLRFEWQFAVGAIVALIHDMGWTLGVLVFTGYEFNLAIVAALLTIVGYSINDTVVVFDRQRENLRKFKTTPLKDVLNLSLNETLSRTVMTSVTTFLALLALFIFGGDVIRGFVFAMMWGVLIGTYSSIFVASVLVYMLDVKRDWDKKAPAAGTKFSNIDA